jgi:hypothetical protein
VEREMEVEREREKYMTTTLPRRRRLFPQASRVKS